MVKMPLYKIFKIGTERLDREGYDIKLSFNQACVNGELVEIASNQALRKLIEIMEREKIDGKEENFIPCYMCIHVDKKKHYKEIKKNGIYVNGKKFIRYSCGAGNARNNNVFMIWEELFNELYWYMSCGIKDGIKVVKNKWSAYFALTTSSSYPIPEPKVCVIPDYKVNMNKVFDYITYDDTKNEYNIERKPVDVNGYVPFDGMGLASVEYMKQVAEHLQMDYVPSAMVIRQCWIKGLVACMDFKMFADEIAKENQTIKDLWGIQHDINEIDLILTESQFKMWHGYDSWNDYVSKYRERGIEWGCAKVSPKKDKTSAFTNYQFIQVLDLDDDDIKNLCRKTIDWFHSITNGDAMSMILYMCGNEKPLELEKISDASIKALIYNNELINDNYIKQKIIRSLNKKIREAYSGRLIVDGNFSFMISDPYALLEYAMGLEPKGLLNEFEHYNGFWNKRNVSKVAGMRSPLTHYSEVNILNLKKTDEMRKWYKWLDVGCTVFNIFGDDTFRSADSDFDGDILMTTNQKEFIEKRLQNSVPITYPKRTAVKHKINPMKLYDSDMDSFDSQIGYVTNCSTAMYVMLEKFEKNSLEYDELKKRLLITRKLQGDAIDQAKGISTDPFPQHWVDKRRCENSSFDMSLVIKKKPYFQKYIYPKLMHECRKFEENMENYSYTIFGIPSSENKDEQFIKIKNDLNPVLDYPSVMIRLCHYLEKEIPEIKSNSKKVVQDIVDDILIDYEYGIKFEYESFVNEILKEYKQFRHDKREIIEEDEENTKSNFYFFCRNLRKKLIEEIGNDKDMANIVVYVSYGGKSQENKDFAWNVCGEDILKNVIKNRQEKIYLPVEDKNGDIEYLGKKYSRKEIQAQYDYFG